MTSGKSTRCHPSEERKIERKISREKILVFQQNGSGERKIQGIRRYGKERFIIETVSIDEALPPILDDTRDYLPSNIQADLVLDFLKHPDLSHDLAVACEETSGKRGFDPPNLMRPFQAGRPGSIW
jgi:hypothetical protein